MSIYKGIEIHKTQGAKKVVLCGTTERKSVER